jgi:hypothetical protein
MGFGAAFKPMNYQDSGFVAGRRLPVTFGEQSGLRGYLKNPVLCGHTVMHSSAGPPTR